MGTMQRVVGTGRQNQRLIAWEHAECRRTENADIAGLIVAGALGRADRFCCEEGKARWEVTIEQANELLVRWSGGKRRACGFLHHRGHSIEVNVVDVSDYAQLEQMLAGDVSELRPSSLRLEHTDNGALMVMARWDSSGSYRVLWASATLWPIAAESETDVERIVRHLTAALPLEERQALIALLDGEVGALAIAAQLLDDGWTEGLPACVEAVGLLEAA